MTRPPRVGYWAHGEVLALAKEAGVSYRALLLVLHRSRRTSYPMALKLARATKTMGREIDRDVWLDNLGIRHPAFRGDPVAPSIKPDMMCVNIDKKEAV